MQHTHTQSSYHSVQELDAAPQFGLSLAELSEQQASDGLPLAEAAVVLFYAQRERCNPLITTRIQLYSILYLPVCSCLVYFTHQFIILKIKGLKMRNDIISLPRMLVGSFVAAVTCKNELNNGYTFRNPSGHSGLQHNMR